MSIKIAPKTAKQTKTPRRSGRRAARSAICLKTATRNPTAIGVRKERNAGIAISPKAAKQMERNARNTISPKPTHRKEPDIERQPNARMAISPKAAISKTCSIEPERAQTNQNAQKEGKEEPRAARSARKPPHEKNPTTISVQKERNAGITISPKAAKQKERDAHNAISPKPTHQKDPNFERHPNARMAISPKAAISQTCSIEPERAPDAYLAIRGRQQQERPGARANVADTKTKLGKQAVIAGEGQEQDCCSCPKPNSKSKWCQRKLKTGS